MAAQTFSFSRNIFFTGLDAQSPGPQPATLVWEIENDPTLSAAGILVRNDNITIVETVDDGVGDGPDQVVGFEINRETPGPVFTPTSWQELTQGERDAFLAVFAAHEGIPTRSDAQTEVSNAATTNPDVDPWVTKIEFTTEPLREGTYVIEASCEHKLTTTPVAATDKSEVRLQIDLNDGGGEGNRGTDTWPFDFPHFTTMTNSQFVREGQRVTVKLEHRRTGNGMISEIRRARLSLRPLNGTEM